MEKADIVCQYLRIKLSSLLEEAESDPNTPSDILSRFQSIGRTINSMPEGTITTSPPIPYDLLYRIIDALSEIRIFAYHHHQKAAVSSKKGFFWELIITPLSQYRSLKKIKNQLNKIENDLKNPPKSDILPLPKPKIQPRFLVLAASRIFGFESQSREIESWLIENISNTEELTAIGITGRCGCGKTALAQEVFSSPIIREEFSPRIWVNLSDVLFEAKGRDTRVKILTSILEKFAYGLFVSNCSDFITLSEELKAVLTGKRYLIVLDNAWRVDEWYADLVHSLPKGSGGGVIMTSRRESFIRWTVGEKRVIRLPPDLDNNDMIWEIFVDCVTECWSRDYSELGDVAGVMVNEQKLEEIKKDVIRTCDGLPLAARTLAPIIYESFQSPQHPRNISNYII